MTPLEEKTKTIKDKDLAMALISEILDWAIGNDYMDYIGEIEEEYKITVDRALKILNSNT